MNTVFIYTLCHPITGEIRYVGKTKNPQMRFHNHCNKLHNEKTHKRNWINKLRKKELKPVMDIIDEVPEDEWKQWEIYWIEQFRAWGFRLLNHGAGGEGSVLGNSTSFKKGNKSWNEGKGNYQSCLVCKDVFKCSKSSNRKFCSRKCTSEFKRSIQDKTYYKKGHTPWNKGMNIKLKKSIPVLQYSKDDKFIKEYAGCKEVSEKYNCIPENIRRCCVGASKTARGFKWRYKTNTENE